MDSFRDKVVWITGASSGIGKALAMVLAEEGASLILSGRNTQALSDVSSRCRGSMVLPMDLGESKLFPSLAQKVIEERGHIDLLILNGGISQRSTAWETSLEVDRKIMEINYFGNVTLTKAVLPYMRRQGSGHIVAISSLSGKFGYFQRSAYSASKHALVGFFESLRLEEFKHKIYITLVYPGLVRTAIAENALDGKGRPVGKRDHMIAEGIAPEKCASDILKGIRKRKGEVFSGGKELRALSIKRFLPKLFFRLLLKRDPDL